MSPFGVYDRTMVREGRPVIGLLTDFGQRDPYVAAMKLVIAERCDAEILDLGHEISPQGIEEAAFFLAFVLRSVTNARNLFVVAVVDPGVGSQRRILAAQRGPLTLLAPDNGILSLVVGSGWTIHSVENERFFLPHGSATFHGRDRFAPVAAALANGTPLAELGPAVSVESIRRIDYTPPKIGIDEVIGTVISIDRFGNVVTDVDPAVLGNLGEWVLELDDRRVSLHASNYEEMSGRDEPFLIVGSLGTIEVSVSGGSAAGLLQLERLSRLVLRREVKEG
ncbi:MAG: S-adenosyl-l-methionine hydroxide adenosyltransferase family protein [Thermoanaerobaculia bacterium]